MAIAHLHLPDRLWYPKKTEPSFAGMLTTLRRISWEGSPWGDDPDSPATRSGW